jgi:hypothetical protein
VSIDGASAQVVSSALATSFAGVYHIPASAPVGDDVPMTLSRFSHNPDPRPDLYNYPAFEVTLGKKTAKSPYPVVEY